MKELRLREARPADVPKIEEFNVKQNERDGTNYPVPRLFDGMGRNARHVPISLVIEDVDGVPTGSLYVEEVPELCFAGPDPRSTAVARQDIEALAWALRQLGFKSMRTVVPRQVLHQIRKPLLKSGFVERDDLVIFTRSLDPQKEVGDEPRSAESDL